MFKHYLKIAFRNMRKYKLQSLVCIIGLSIGISFLAIGYNWMKYETSYDGFYPGSKNIYRIYGIDKQSGRTIEALPFILLEKLRQEFPEVEKVTAVYPRFGSRISWEEQTLGDVIFMFVDEHFLELFPPKIICGNTSQLLHTTEETVITEKFAKKYWTSPEDAIGKVLRDSYGQMLTIVAVIENPPENSNFQLDAYRADINGRLSLQQTTPDNQWNISFMGGQTFVLLNENVNKSD